MEFTTDSIFDALKRTLGVIDDEERRKQIEAYLDAAKPNVERAVFDLLSHFAETTDNEVAAHYQVSLNYRPGVLNLDVRQRPASEPPDEAWSVSEGDVEKITLRIPGELKDLATEAAAQAGLSLNSWFIRMLGRALRSAADQDVGQRRRGVDVGMHVKFGEGRQGRTGRRLSGWVGPES